MSVKVHEGFCLDSAQDRFFYIDHFLGDQVQDEWRDVGTGSAVVVDQQTGGIVRITTGAVANNIHYIDWNDIRSLHVNKKAIMEIRMKLTQITQLYIRLQLYFDGNNRTGFYLSNVAGANNWLVGCRDGGVETFLNSGVLSDTDYHIYRVECHTHGANHVHFYIDGTETTNSPINTNIPDDVADFLQPWLHIQTRENVAKSMDVDYVALRQDR